MVWCLQLLPEFLNFYFCPVLNLTKSTQLWWSCESSLCQLHTDRGAYTQETRLVPKLTAGAHWARASTKNDFSAKTPTSLSLFLFSYSVIFLFLMLVSCLLCSACLLSVEHFELCEHAVCVLIRWLRRHHVQNKVCRFLSLNNSFKCKYSSDLWNSLQNWRQGSEIKSNVVKSDVLSASGDFLTCIYLWCNICHLLTYLLNSQWLTATNWPDL